jgi:phosphatidylglycerol---prolipoprotein diacylglyceryl transferase
MFPTIQLGPVALPTSGLVVLVGIWIGLSVSERYSDRFQVQPSHINNLVFLAIISGLLGARLGYVLQHTQAFIANPVSIISRNVELLDPFIGFVCAILAGIIYTQKNKLSPLSVLDALVPMMVIMLIAISLSDLASGSAYGKPSRLPWAIELWGTRRHPTQIYMLLLSTGFVWIFWPGKQAWSSGKPGIYFFSFLASLAGLIIFLEAFRSNSRILLEGIRTNQVIAWLVLAFSLLSIRNIQSRQTQS